ncbi:hypothetical protein [Novilysobacter arseniciresistens]|uniref:hypothetical protein n=1 Tax=Novilysobacter arseniciresistens TaxID=1385522 RepID=UPI000563C11B|nr:hypothetical protein [Lysobacter arseniciresistens]
MKLWSPDELTDAASVVLDAEIDPFPNEIASVFGQSVAIKHSGKAWVDKIRFEHVGSREWSMRWNKPFHSTPFIEWIVRTWLIERVQLRIDLRPAKEIAQRIYSFSWDEDLDNLEPQLATWLESVAQSGALAGQPAVPSGARLFYRWCLEEELPHFSERRLVDLERVGLKMRSGRELVTLRDPSYGPLTSAEVADVQRRLETSKKEWTRWRAMFLLGRDWGLRPIQLALLKVQDFGTDELGPFVMVPSVKGIRRSRLRREPHNLVKRHIADDTAAALEAQVSDAKEQLKTLVDELEQLLEGSRSTASSQLCPMFPARRAPRRATHFLANPSITTYLFHVDAQAITNEYRDFSLALSIPARVGLPSEEGQLMILTAYRLRRTKAASMVISGCSPDEVAEALDHQGVDSVSHYFSYSKDLHDYVNQLHNRTREITDAANMWSGRFRSGERPADIAGVPIGRIGSCARQSPCPYHPTVTCYTCPSFQPSVDGDHRGAQKAIELLTQLVTTHSSGPVKRQLDAALVSASGLIKAIETGLTNA